MNHNQNKRSRQNVLTAYLDAPVEKTEHLQETGVLIYGVELKSKLVIWVDAVSGEVIGLE